MGMHELTCYTEISYNFQSVIIIMFLGLTLMQLYLVINCIHLKTSKRLMLLSVGLLISSEILLQLSIGIHKHNVYYDNIHFPVIGGIAAFIIIMSVSAWMLINLHMVKKRSINAMSIKESLDTLPEGIMFYYDTGMPKLVNHQMTEIYETLTGDRLLSAKGFWERLTGGDIKGVIRDGNEPLYHLNNGRVLNFKRFTHDINGQSIYELRAMDVTKEYQLTEALNDKKRQADYVNRRLKTLFKMMEYTVMERELLEMKTALHDNLGRGLLLAKRYLVTKDEGMDDFKDMWRQNIRLLRNEQPEFWQEPYYMSMKYAELMGVKVVITGELPVDEGSVSVIDTAITVQTTNTLRHAYGHTVYISSIRKSGELIVTFTNDGEHPYGDIIERGGLKNLRTKVENAGGSMKIIASPQFVMELRL